MLEDKDIRGVCGADYHGEMEQIEAELDLREYGKSRHAFDDAFLKDMELSELCQVLLALIEDDGVTEMEEEELSETQVTSSETQDPSSLSETQVTSSFSETQERDDTPSPEY